MKSVLEAVGIEEDRWIRREARSSPNEMWKALKAIAASIEESQARLDERWAALDGADSPDWRMKRAIDAAKAAGKGITSMTWSQTAGWLVVFE